MPQRRKGWSNKWPSAISVTVTGGINAGLRERAVVFDLMHGRATEFFGVPTEFADGSDVFSLDAVFARVVAQVRESPVTHVR